MVQNESVLAIVDASTETQIFGSYATVSYILSGEHRKMKNGKPSGLDPDRPFHFTGGGGAWELLTPRYAILDTRKTSVPTQELRDAVLGVSWVLDRDIRVLLNGVCSVLEEDSARQVTRGIHLRFQLGF